MLVLIRYRKKNGERDSIMINARRPEDIWHIFLEATEKQADIVWFLPQCLKPRW
jgi:hypothetical protein